MENLKLWNEVKNVPQEFTKKITGGRLGGMTDIKPQWRLKVLTEKFGVCGFGWKTQNINFQYKECGNEIICVCTVELLIKDCDMWSEPIIGVGGSRLQTQEKNGIYVSDEAEKMAYTDAISVACKSLGIGADIYLGLPNTGTKYDTQPQQAPQPPQKPTLVVGSKTFDAIVDRLTKKQATIDDVLKHYTVEKPILEQLKSL